MGHSPLHKPHPTPNGRNNIVAGPLFNTCAASGREPFVVERFVVDPNGVAIQMWKSKCSSEFSKVQV